MRGVHRHVGVQVRIMHMVHAQRCRHVLQFTIAVRHTHGTNVIALGEKQFQNKSAIFLQAFRMGNHLHSFTHARHTRRLQLGRTLNFDETQAARAHFRQSFEMTQGRNFDPVFDGDVENRLVGVRADFAVVNFQCRNLCLRIHNLQTPAGHFLSWMCATYSSRK